MSPISSAHARTTPWSSDGKGLWRCRNRGSMQRAHRLPDRGQPCNTPLANSHIGVRGMSPKRANAMGA
eukprot:1015450-Pyramimonas_sp.AAC.1